MGENPPGREGSHAEQFYSPIIITEIPNANLQIRIPIPIAGVVLNLTRANCEKPSWIKWFNPTKGFGFIEREDKEKDVFVHVSAVRDAGMNGLDEGQALTFEVEDGPKGPSAVNLKTA